eukprot:gene53084-72509_t
MLHHFSSVDTGTAKYAHKAVVRMEICVGLGRFFGEAWIGSAASLLAADCLPDHVWRVCAAVFEPRKRIHVKEENH